MKTNIIDVLNVVLNSNPSTLSTQLKQFQILQIMYQDQELHQTLDQTLIKLYTKNYIKPRSNSGSNSESSGTNVTYEELWDNIFEPTGLIVIVLLEQKQSVMNLNQYLILFIKLNLVDAMDLY